MRQLRAGGPSAASSSSSSNNNVQSKAEADKAPAAAKKGLVEQAVQRALRSPLLADYPDSKVSSKQCKKNKLGCKIVVVVQLIYRLMQADISCTMLVLANCQLNRITES